MLCTLEYDKKAKKICGVRPKCMEAWNAMANNCDAKYCNPVTNGGRDFVKCIKLALKILKKAWGR
jgi:hypothetical protein